MSSGIGWKFEARKALGNFYYATPPYGRLHLVLEAAAGTDLETFSRQWLTGPLDMNETKWILRPEVYRSSNKYGLSSTALDLARFGQMILQEGQWNGKQIVSRAYLKKMLSPSQEDAAFFGYLWWLNGHPISMAMLTSEYTANSLADHAPEDMVAAMGACDRRIYVVPSLKLVVVRLGFYPELGKPSSEFDRSFLEENFWRLLMKAVPNDHHQ
jgi:CubicO group peptidase (beta-lactamase class C family)